MSTRTDTLHKTETAARAALKGALWTLMGLVVMALTGFAMTGSWGVGGALALLNAAIGFVTYVVYERIWARISWGRA